jgi:glutamate synthase (NADPH) small chain
LLADLNITVDDLGTIARDDNFMSDVDGIFVAGELGRGPSLIVWASLKAAPPPPAWTPISPAVTSFPSPSAPTTSRLPDRPATQRAARQCRDHQ